MDSGLLEVGEELSGVEEAGSLELGVGMEEVVEGTLVKEATSLVVNEELVVLGAQPASNSTEVRTSKNDDFFIG